MLEIQTKNVEPDIVVLEMAGRLTMGRQCQQLEWSTESLVKENKKKIIFDLSRVNQIDSTGVGIIVMAAGQIKNAGGQLHVYAQGHVENVLRLTGIDKVVAMHPSIATAVAGF